MIDFITRIFLDTLSRLKANMLMSSNSFWIIDMEFLPEIIKGNPLFHSS